MGHLITKSEFQKKCAAIAADHDMSYPLQLPNGNQILKPDFPVRDLEWYANHFSNDKTVIDPDLWFCGSDGDMLFHIYEQKIAAPSGLSWYAINIEFHDDETGVEITGNTIEQCRKKLDQMFVKPEFREE